MWLTTDCIYVPSMRTATLKKKLFIANHFGGAWHHCWYRDDYSFDYALNEFFDDVFIENWGLALKAEDMDYPTSAVWNYND